MVQRLNRLHWVSLAAFSAFVFLFGIHYYPLANGEEGQTAQIAREMLSLHQYVIPYFNFIPHFESPPLYHWLTSLSFTLFGINAGAARLVSALSMLSLCFLMARFCFTCRKPHLAWLSVLVMSSSVGVVWLGRAAVNNGFFAMTTAACLFYFFHWFETQKSNMAWVSGLFLGMALLTEGLIAVLFVFPLLFILYWCFENKQTSLKHYFHPITLTLCFLPLLLWLGLVSLSEPGTVSLLIQQDYWLQIFSEGGSTTTQTQPFYYYLLGLLLFLFPWGFLLIPRLREIMNHIHILDNLTRFVIIWLAYAVAFFSLMPVKSQFCFLSLAVPATLLIAQQIDIFFQKHKTHWLRNLFYLTSTLSLMIAISFAVLIYHHDDLLTNAEQLGIFAASAMLVFTLFGFILNYSYRNLPRMAFYLNVTLIIPVLIVTVVIAKQAMDYYSEAHMAAVIDQHFSQRQVYVYKEIERFSSIVFYTKNPVHVLEPNGLPPTKFAINTPSAGEFKQLANDQALLVVLDNNLELMEFSHAQSPTKFCQVFRDGQALLLSNRREDCELFMSHH